jgi:hypothetical protein
MKLLERISPRHVARIRTFAGQLYVDFVWTTLQSDCQAATIRV